MHIRSFPFVAKMASHAIFQYNVLVIDIDNTTLGLIWLLKMTILRLLGSSDDKEKIGVARIEGSPLRWFQRTRIEETVKKTKSKKSRQRYFSITGWTDAEKITYVGALTWSTPGILVSPVEPTPGKLNTSVQWTQQLRQNLYTGWTDARYWWTSVQLSRELVFQQLHSAVKPTLHRLITSVDWGSRWSITASWKMHSPVKPVMTKTGASV